MKREIKFRAWDKVNKIMVVSNQLLHLEFDKTGVNWIGAWGSDYDSEGDQCQKTFQMEKDNFKLMQFTGLKDKNGKEIYEGDIVEWYDKKEIVEFNNGRFRITGHTAQDNDYSEEWEVIGNIYDSPLKEDYPSN